MMEHVCKIDGCEKVTKHKTMCPKHWYQVNKFGEPIKTNFDQRPAIIKDGVAKIPLGLNAVNGYAIVDEEFAYLDKYKWNISDQGYAKMMLNGKNEKMHRFIFGDSEKSIDHINRNKLDNRLTNLREADHSENKYNKPKQANNTSGYKGVFRSRNKWRVEIQAKGIKYALGSFDSNVEAAKAYNEKAKELFGEFAYLNKVLTGKRG